MAKTKNVEMYERALKLYRLNVLTTEEKRKEFDDLNESAQEKKVNGFKQRNKALFLCDSLNKLDKLNRDELTKLKLDLENYLKKIDDAFRNINDKEIKKLEEEKENLTQAHKKEIERINKLIENLRGE